MELDRYLAIIPARTGSKRLPGKNFRDFCGKPLWRWGVDCAIEAGFHPRNIVVSSDANEPFVWPSAPWMDRPPVLCVDESCTTWEAVEYVCETLNHFGPVAVLQPTSPLRTAEQVRDAIENHAAHAKHRPAFLYTVDSVEMGPNDGVYVSSWKEWVGGRAGMTICRLADCGPAIDTQEDWDRAEAAMRERSNAAAPKEAGP